MDQDQALQSAVAKAARRLVPFLALCYMVNFLDRVNVGFAALAMNEDLGFTPAVFGFGAGIFFVGYILFEVPSNLALHRFGARIWIARIMISWGIVAMAMALVERHDQLLSSAPPAGRGGGRFLPRHHPLSHLLVSVARARPRRGAVHGGDPARHRVRRAALGRPARARWALGLNGWQWMFLIEGVPAVLLGFVTLKFLDDRPEHAKWLTADERDSARRAARHGSGSDARHRLSPAQPRLHAPARAHARHHLFLPRASGSTALAFWMPQVIQTFGLSPLKIGFLTAIPYVFAAIRHGAMGAALRSYRRAHLACGAAAGLAGLAFVWSAVSGPLLPTMLALTLVTVGIYAALGAFWSLPTAILTGMGAAAGIALVNSIGNLGGLLAPAIVGYLREATGDFTAALFFLAGSLVLGAALTLLFGYAARKRSESYAK